MSKNCFVTLLGSDDYLTPVLMLYESYLNIKSKADFKILVTDNVSNDIISFLEYNKIPYILKPNFYYKISDEWTDDFSLVDKLSKSNMVALKKHYKAQQKRTKRYVTCMNKLYCFGMSNYDKIFFLDGDMIFLQNCDELFNFDSLSFARTIPNNPESLIATIFGCKPKKNFDEMLFKKAKQINFNWTDETFFRLMFSKVKNTKVIDLNTYCPTLAKSKNLKDAKLIHYLLSATFYLTEEQTVKSLEEVLKYWDIPILDKYYTLVKTKYQI